MAQIIRENDINMEQLTDRCEKLELEVALNDIGEAITALDGLRRLKPEGEPTHEIMRALAMVEHALHDAIAEK